MNPEAIKSIIDPVTNTLNVYVIPLLFIIATTVFIWGVVQYVIKSEDQVAQKKAKIIITLGIIGLTIITAAWIIVKILILYFGVGGTGIPIPNPLTL